MKHNLILFWVCIAMSTLIVVAGFFLGEFPLVTTDVVILFVASLYFLGHYTDQQNDEDS